MDFWRASGRRAGTAAAAAGFAAGGRGGPQGVEGAWSQIAGHDSFERRPRRGQRTGADVVHKRNGLGRGSDRADVRGGFRIRERPCEKNGFRCGARKRIEIPAFVRRFAYWDRAVGFRWTNAHDQRDVGAPARLQPRSTETEEYLGSGVP